MSEPPKYAYPYPAQVWRLCVAVASSTSAAVTPPSSSLADPPVVVVIGPMAVVVVVCVGHGPLPIVVCNGGWGGDEKKESQGKVNNIQNCEVFRTLKKRLGRQCLSAQLATEACTLICSHFQFTLREDSGK
ncbi:hypothetical protein RJ639_026238 [Escallonia herrerae]|uniref:Uncharacterized protein n=1 Tax=Escallonia herrerae TaxID=1293975 RepID=A0AA88RU64_9ASTE|nr:hypothetical protein RJ639_026238 [Escallonia herrerae]